MRANLGVTYQFESDFFATCPQATWSLEGVMPDSKMATLLPWLSRRWISPAR